MPDTNSYLSHPKYRPDIDGLRSLAVLAVVAFHAFPNLMKGGFIGVDVFFVISGYLISTIIFESLDQGAFSFAEFYSRRIRRILPALILVLVACFAFGWFSLLAEEYKQLGKNIAAGAGFVSNFALWSDAGYFDNSSEAKPLLHLWSLGIEEQFYIVWPLLLWGAWKQKFNLLTITILVASISFFLNANGIKHDTVATFYSPQTRFWELLAGSLLAWHTLYRKVAFQSLALKIDSGLANIIYREKGERKGATLANLLSTTGLALLGYGFWQINKDSTFPGVWALIPVTGSVLIIIAGQKAWINRHILSNKIAVWLGLISFPLYLWHWPLLSFARILESETPSTEIRIGLVVLSIMLAWFTCMLIERPIRFGKYNNAKVGTLLMLLVAVGYIGYNTYERNGLTFRSVIKLNATLDSMNNGGDLGTMSLDCGIFDKNIRELFAFCGSDKRGDVKFALLGDSKAAALHTGLFRTSTNQGRWLFIGGNGKNGAPTPMLASDNDPNRKLTRVAIEAINNNEKIKVVVIATAIRALFGISDGVTAGDLKTYDFNYLKKLKNSDQFNTAFDQLNRVVTKFTAKGKKVILVHDNPALPNPQDCIERKTSIDFLNHFLKTNPNCDLSLDVFYSDIALYRSLLEKIKESNPEMVKVFDPTDIYCNIDTRICKSIQSGRLMYSYTDHISDFASELVGVELNNFIAKQEIAPSNVLR